MRLKDKSDYSNNWFNKFIYIPKEKRQEFDEIYQRRVNKKVK